MVAGSIECTLLWWDTHSSTGRFQVAVTVDAHKWGEKVVKHVVLW